MEEIKKEVFEKLRYMLKTNDFYELRQNDKKTILYNCPSVDIYIKFEDSFSYKYNGNESNQPLIKWDGNILYILEKQINEIVKDKRMLIINLPKSERYIYLIGNSMSGSLIIKNNIIEKIFFNSMSGSSDIDKGTVNIININSMSGNINILLELANFIKVKTMSGLINININDTKKIISAESMSGDVIINGKTLSKKIVILEKTRNIN